MRNNPLFFVTRDIERAPQIHPDSEIFIISNFSEYSKKLANGQAQVLLLHEEKLLDTLEILMHPETVSFIQKNASGKKPDIVVFKNTPQIENLCQKNGWNLLNPSARLSSQVEEKISQIEWLGPLSRFLPPHQILLGKEVTFTGKPFMVQFNRAHTGSGTILIENQKKLEETLKQFPNRPVRVTEYIHGTMLTSNNVVTPHTTLTGNINVQITGLPPFTDNPFSTIGNDFWLGKKLLNETIRNEYENMVKTIGDRLQNSGWKGLFGVDILLEEKTNQLFLIEINARQPAGTSFESELQQKMPKNENELTTFEAHLLALSGETLTGKNLISIPDGAQIIKRITSTPFSQKIALQKLSSVKNIQVIPYENTKIGSDSIRIQTDSHFLDENGKLNDFGKKIAEIFCDDTKTLSPNALAIIKRYQSLPFPGTHSVSVPYYNNKRQRARAALRVLIGKGTPEEIVEETQILFLKEKIKFNDLTNEEIKKFLVDHHLGIDCSGLSYFILHEEMLAKKNTVLSKVLVFPHAKGFLRKLLIRFRPVENINVMTFHHEKNSAEKTLKEALPGDMILLLETGIHHDLNHMMVIHQIDFENGIPKTLHYTHSLAWSSDGPYGHGIKQGTIEIEDISKPLLSQKWREGNPLQQNETFERAKTATSVSLKRFRALL